jgi:hypothetical protein
MIVLMAVALFAFGSIAFAGDATGLALYFAGLTSATILLSPFLRDEEVLGVLRGRRSADNTVTPKEVLALVGGVSGLLGTLIATVGLE